MAIDFRLIDQETECSICGLNKWLEKDHVESRAQAPSRVLDPSNLWTICRTCHDKKTNNIWEVIEEEDQLGQYVAIVEPTTRGNAIEKRVVWRRYIPPESFDGGNYIGALNSIEGGVYALETGAKFLTNEQLIAAFQVAGSIGERSWKLQAALLYEARARMNWGSINDALMALARSFGIKRARVYDYLKIYEEFSQTEFWNESDVPAAVYREAARCESPREAFEKYLDNKALDPGYTATNFKLEQRDMVLQKGIPVCPSCHNELQCRWCKSRIWPHPYHRPEPTADTPTL